MLMSSDALWKAGPEFSILRHFPFKHVRSFGKDTWRRQVARRPFSSVFIFIPPQARDEHKIVKCFKNDASTLNRLLSDLLVEDQICTKETDFESDNFLSEETDVASGHSKSSLLSDQIVEEPWLLHDASGGGVVHDDEYFKCLHSDNLDTRFFNESTAEGQSGIDYVEVTRTDKKSDFSRTCYESVFPIEEPWLYESIIKCSNRDVKMIPEVSTCEEHSRSEEAHQRTDDEHFQEPDKLLPVEDSSTSSKDSVTTVILINSSVCTMQRIAVLEDDKLVELLLEPVKNNVQCDSVYLGVVTALAPHLNGAFVNIGTPRNAFMNIKHYKEPFILPPFCDDTNGREINGFDHDEFSEKSDLPEAEATLDEAIEDDDIDDDSVEYVENDVDDPEVLEGNGSGSVGHGVDSHFQNYTRKNGHQECDQSVEQDSNGPEVTPKDKGSWGKVRKGTKIIVQVIKEGLGTKGPSVTAYPKLRSRFWILVASSRTIGISKKISGVERIRLKVIAKTLQPPGFGLVVRTVAAGHSFEELKKDLEGLLSTWKSIVEHAISAALAADEGVDGSVPVMLHQAMGQTLSIVQDYFNDKVKSMVVDSPRTYHEVKNYLQDIAPDLCDRVELYNNKTPLFDEYQIEGEIDNLLKKSVSLPNGGSLVIEQTEALFSIDVNSGQSVVGQGTSREEASLEVNLAAARQIARELRLRDIGGIIVVDFISMVIDANKRLVYEEVKKAVERDRSTVNVSELSKHGLMEITRKRVRPSVTFMISEPCFCCHGVGRVEALETVFSKIEHEICRMLSTTDEKAGPEDPKSWPRFILMVDQYMANYLTKGKRSKLAVLSSSLKVWIVLKVARDFTRGTFDLKLLSIDNDHKYQHQPPPVPVFRPADAQNQPKKAIIFPIKKPIRQTPEENDK